MNQCILLPHLRRTNSVFSLTELDYVFPSFPSSITDSLRFSPYQSSANRSYETHQLVSSKRRESTGMSNLPFSSHCQAHFDRLHLFRCSTYRDNLELIHSKNFLKMSNLETSLLLLKICLLYTSPSPRD